MEIKKQTWRDIQLSLIWIMVFTLIVASFTLWVLWGELGEKSSQLGICQKNFEVWSKQVKSGRIILELEK